MVNVTIYDHIWHTWILWDLVNSNLRISHENAKSLVSFMVDVEGIRIFPRAPELFGGAVAMDRPRSVHALHVRVQAAPNGHLRKSWLIRKLHGLQVTIGI